MKFRKKQVVIDAYQTDKELYIDTLEGRMHANAGDWIITGIKGEKYPCDGRSLPDRASHYRTGSCSADASDPVVLAFVSRTKKEKVR